MYWGLGRWLSRLVLLCKLEDPSWGPQQYVRVGNLELICNSSIGKKGADRGSWGPARQSNLKKTLEFSERRFLKK